MASSKEELLKKLEKYKKPSNKRYLRLNGYWVSPKGQVIDIGSDNHIDKIIENPIRYNISSRFIKSEHEKYGERIGQEGDARDNIMIKVLKDGWIRVRARRNFVSVQVWDFDRKTIRNLESFATEGYDEGFNGYHIAPNEVFKVSALRTNKVRQTEVESLVKGGLVESIEFDYYEGVLSSETVLPSFSSYINNKKEKGKH